MPAVAAADPVAAPPRAISAPGVLSLSPLATTRDGNGGLVYLQHAGGVTHVFVSHLVGGVFQAPQQVDAGFGGPSSQPVIAAGNGGDAVIAFVNGGGLYVSTTTSTHTGFGSPRLLAAGSSNPAVGMSNYGKAYVAFTASGAGGHDVRVAYYNHGQWAMEPTPLDASAGDDAGTGSGRPDVAVAGDGVAIVVWGEGGDIYSRRVWGTSPSVISEQADPPSVGGWSEVSADEPTVATEGNSSYADVAFHETLSSGGATQSRVLMSRLRASVYDRFSQPDGLGTPGGSGADQPQVAMNEYGRGFVSSARTDTNAVIAAPLGSNGTIGTPAQVNNEADFSLPYAAPGTAGLTSTLIAWQHDPGLFGSPEIRLRYAGDGRTLGSERVVSSPAQGPTDAADGLSTGGDGVGDAVAAWLQGPPGARGVVVDQLYAHLGGFSMASSYYQRSAQPRLRWDPPNAVWGPIRYLVTVDGRQVAQTYSPTVRVPSRLSNGRHTLQVRAINPAGLSSAMRTATFFVDTVKPQVKLTLTGALQPRSLLRASVTYTDAPRGVHRSAASGVKSVVISWGDGSRYRIVHTKLHAYRRPGRYRIKVTVTDRAGNATTVSKVVRIG